MKRYINNQKFSSCQLVSLWNTALFHNLDPNAPPINSKKYREICKKAGCLYGGVINMNFEIDRLGMKAVSGKYNLRWIKNNLPVSLSIFCHRGYHSVLVVDVYKNNLTLTNYAKNRLHKLKWNALLNKVNKNTNPVSWKVK